jgi:starch synthase
MSQSEKHVVMVASENGALSGGKVGGVADVIKELPQALAALGWNVTTIIPSYGFLHTKNNASFLQNISFPFRGKKYTGELWEVASDFAHGSITHLLFEHPEIKGEPIYYNDAGDSPFVRDATKYALFCSAVGQYLQTIRTPFTLHLHDWHAATILLLGELHPEFASLREISTVFTIHNLSIQGTRPMSDHDSSLESWFPELFKTTSWVSLWKDPRYAEPCYTPMEIGIRFADKINTVSPGYAEEILQPSNHRMGEYRGEGLEPFLQNASVGKRLYGILNGCSYRSEIPTPKLPFNKLSENIIAEIARQPDASNAEILDESVFRLKHFSYRSPRIILTCVTRIVEQKVRLLFEEGSDGIPVIDHLMRMLEARNSLFIFLGTGVAEYETLLREYFEKYRRIIFINGYFEDISRLLYANGDLFLMPSLFEPCGISQMIAMREGQPCLVHAVGGLKDTVLDMVNGFSFHGESLADTADNFVGMLEKAMYVLEHDKPLWENIRRGARDARFTWEKSAQQYIDLLYSP